jgi:hypothetical protein
VRTGHLLSPDACAPEEFIYSGVGLHKVIHHAQTPRYHRVRLKHTASVCLNFWYWIQSIRWCKDPFIPNI